MGRKEDGQRDDPMRPWLVSSAPGLTCATRDWSHALPVALTANDIARLTVCQRGDTVRPERDLDDTGFGLVASDFQLLPDPKGKQLDLNRHKQVFITSSSGEGH